jgi:hypothetical protein
MAEFKQWVQDCIEGKFETGGSSRDCVICGEYLKHITLTPIRVTLPDAHMISFDWRWREPPNNVSYYFMGVCKDDVFAQRALLEEARAVARKHNKQNKTIKRAIKSSSWIPQWSEIPALLQSYCMERSVRFNL